MNESDHPDEPSCNEPSCGEQTMAVERCLALLRDGDTAVRGELLNLTQQRLLRLTAKMKRDFRGIDRWEQTEDVFQNASMRLYQAMASTPIENARHFFRLAAVQIRRELIDMCRHHKGVMGQAANHATQHHGGDNGGPDPIAAMPASGEASTDLQAWSEFHRCVEELPDREREVFELLWYHELQQDEAAELLGTSTRTVKRIWRSARLALHDRLSVSSRQSVAI